MSIDWGSVPAWTAFGTAAVAAWFTGRNLSIAHATRKEDVDQKHKQQASAVAVWLETEDKFFESKRIVVMGLNGSDVPVYEVAIWSKIGDGVSPLIDLPVLPPGAVPHEIEPASEAYRRANPDDMMPMLAIMQELGGVGVAVQFRDSSNVWWYRDFDGSLFEGKNPPAPTWREEQEAKPARGSGQAGAAS